MNRTCDGCNMCCYIPGINEPTLQKKEWAAIRAIVRKQEYEGANANR